MTGISVTVTNGPKIQSTITTGSLINVKFTSGVPGIGIPAGGTTGQSLIKTDGTDYNTEWGNTSVVVELDDLTDTNVPSPTDDHVLTWDSGTGKWISAAQTASAPVDSVNTQIGVVVLDADDISDSATTNKFATAAELSLIASATQPSDNISTLTNDSGFIADITGENLGDLSDVVIATPLDGQVLTYDNGTGEWKNEAIPAGAPDQDLWETISADSGSTIANTTTDTLTIAGGTNVTTAIVGDTLTINATDTGDPDQNIWLNLNADSGTTAANTTTDTFTLTGGTSITTAIVGDVVTITNDAPNVDQNLWLNVAGDTGSTAANTTTDTVTIAGGASITTAMSGDTLTITNDAPNADQNIWLNVTGDTGTTAANTTTDTITIAGGTAVTTTVVGDTITIDSSDTVNPDQDLWDTFNADSGSATANSLTDTFTITGGTSITTAIVGDVVTITNDAPNVDQNIFLNVTGDTGTTAANTTTDTLTIAGGTNVTTTVVGDTITIDATDTGDPDQNLWLNVAGDTGSTAANTVTDTLTIAGGTNVTTAMVGDTLTVNSSGAPDQNIWLNFNADSGSAAANTTSDTFTITGGASITTAIAGDVVTITNDAPNIVQDLWKTVSADTGSAVANTATDTLTVTGGTNVTTTIVGDTLTIDATDTGDPDQNLWLNITGDSGTTAANTTTDTITFTGGTGITTAVSADVLTITNDSPNVVQNLFETLAVATQDNVVADGATDTLTLVAGTGMAITTVAATDTITFTNSSPNVDQNLWLNIAGDTGSTPANITTDTLTIAGGTNVTTAMVGDTLTINATDTGDPDQNLWLNVAGDTGSTAANTTTDTLTIAGGTNVTTAMVGDTLTINATDTGDPDQNLFETISVATQDNVVADGTTDTLTLVAGTGMSITTVGATDTITFTNSAPNADQNLWLTVAGDTGSTAANLTNDTLTIAGGTNVTTTMSGDTLTIDATDVGFANPMTTPEDIIVGGTSGAAERLAKGTEGQILKIVSGVVAWDAEVTPFAGGINDLSDVDTTGLADDNILRYNSISGDWEPEALPAAGDPDQNLWLNVAGDTGSTAANTTTDTVTFAGGTGITTAMSGDTLTITATGGGGGLDNVVEDLTPELGGDLHYNGKDIVDSFGDTVVQFGGGAGSNPEFLWLYNGAAGAGPSITAQGAAANVDLNLNPKAAGRVKIDGQKFPASGGTSGFALVTDGTDTAWTDVSLSSEASPVLGGNLNVSTFDFDDSEGNELLYFAPDTGGAGAVSYLEIQTETSASGGNLRLNANTSQTDATLFLDPQGAGTVDVVTSRITNVVDPTGDQDAATKKYVDDNAMSNPMTTADDLIYGGASGVPTRLAGGTDDEVLTMVSGVPAWAAAGGGGGDPDGYKFTGPVATAPAGTGTDTLIIAEATDALNTNQSIFLGSTLTAYQNKNVATGIGYGAKPKANAVAIGYVAEAWGDNAVAIGRAAEANNNYCVSIGNGAQSTGGTYNIAIGQGSVASSSGGKAIALGRSATASGNESFAQGFGAAATHQSSAALMGGKSRAAAHIAFGTGSYANAPFYAYGDQQRSFYSLFGITTDATQTEIFNTGSSGRIVLAATSTWGFKAHIVARRTDAANEGAYYTVEGAIDNHSGTVAFIGTPTKTVVAEDTAAWDIDVQADDTNDALVVKVTGVASSTIEWYCNIDVIECNNAFTA